MRRFIAGYLKMATIVLTFGTIEAAYGQKLLEHSITQQKKQIVKQEAKEPKRFEHIRVVGHLFNTMHASNDMGRLPQDVLHTAKTIDVVPRELMQQQNAKSLEEALRNVPGITASVGGGTGGMSGHQFLIRGFSAQNDIYEDGLHDFGVYSRDNFNYDSVNVIKGPSSEVFGNGTTGGAINVVTKVPTHTDKIYADFTGGSADYFRGTFDANKHINNSTAVRIEGMGNSNKVVGRDHIYSHRWGIAPSATFGMGTNTIVTVQIMHMNNHAVPDTGVPVLAAPGSSMGKPVMDYGIPRSNWYGKEQDHDKTSDTMETIRLKHKFNDHITFNNELRFGEYGRNSETSKDECEKACTKALFSGHPENAWVSRTANKGPFDKNHPKPIGDSKYYNAAGAHQPYKQTSWSFQDVASTILNFKTYTIRHQLVTGFDMEYVHDQRHQYTYVNPIHKANLLHPNPHIGDVGKVRGDVAPSYLANIAGLGQKGDSTGYGFDAGIFMYDQMWFTKWLSLKGGMRWDRWQTQYNALRGNPHDPDKHFSDVENVINPTASLLIMPTKNTTFYFTYSNSTTPLGMYVTSGSIPIRPNGNGITIAKPEKAQLYEVGAKTSLFHDRLGLTMSLFRLDKANALTSDPVSGQMISTGDSQRNQGIELSASGMITKYWNISATYAYYDAYTTGGTAADIGKRIQYVPKNQATLWSAYDALSHTPYNVTIGGGITWRQSVYLTTTNNAKAPANLDFDAMISHKINRHWTLALNGYNLANRVNYGSLFTNRVTPSPGRTFLGRIAMSY